MIWIIVIIVVLLAGIIWLNSNILSRKPTRPTDSSPSARGSLMGGDLRPREEQFLQSVEKFLEGKLRPVDGQPGNFQIDFFFGGQAFVYEDVIDRGFKGDARKGCLKTRIHADFSLYFTEKPRSTTIKTDVFISSQVPDGPVRPDTRVVLPPSLKGLDVQTNNIRLANRLLADPKIAGVLLKFRSVDSRGYPSMSWKIADGVMILEFHPAERKIPHYHDLTRRISSMDDYLGELTKIVRFFKETPSR